MPAAALVAASAAAAAAGGDACAFQKAAGRQQRVLCHGVSYDLTVPSQCVTGRCGVIVDVHGLTMNGTWEEALTETSSYAAPMDLLTLQPSASTAAPPFVSWGSQCPDSVLAGLDDVISAFDVDKSRLYMGGSSEGGYCANAMMQRPADAARFAAFTVGAAYADIPKDGKYNFLWYIGRHDTFTGNQPGKVEPQISAFRAAWGLTNHKLVDSGAMFERHSYTNDAGTVEVQYLVHNYTLTGFNSVGNLVAGHCAPGGHDAPPNPPFVSTLGVVERLSCPQPDPKQAEKGCWAGHVTSTFYAGHTKKAGAAAAAAACTIPDATAGQHSGECGGIAFTYHVPKACLVAGTCGVVLDVHGWTMNGDIQDLNTGMRALGEKHNFVVVQPSANRDGLLTSWSSKDYPAVWSILEAARDEPKWGIDKARLHFMGFSQGSDMTWSMVAEHADELASVVPMSCPAEKPSAVAAAAAGVPILYSSGYNDGLCKFSTNNKTVDALKKAWQLDAGTVTSQSAHHVRTAYRGPKGQVFEYLTWDYVDSNGGICGAIYKGIGAGHCFPGGGDTKCFGTAPRTSFPAKVSPFSCPSPDPSAAAFKIGEVAAEFFVAHPKRK